MNENKLSPVVETMGVIISLMGLTSLMIGIMAFPIAGSWRTAYSIAFLPVGTILLVGSSIIKPRLGISLFLPAGIVALCVGLITWGGASKDASTAPYLVPVLCGAAAIVGSAVYNIPLILKTAADRRGVVGANVMAMCALAVVIIAGVNYLGSKYYGKSDLTSTGKYTLSSKTKNILANLVDPVKVTVVMPPTDENRPMYDMCYNYAKSMLEDYARLANGKITLRYLNPEDTAENPEAIEFIKESQCDLVRSVVFQSNSTKQVRFTDLFGNDDRNTPDPVFKGESAFTAAIISATQRKKDTIYFTTGQGERSLEPTKGKIPDMAAMAKYVKNDNYEIKQINIAADGIPADCDILAIVGPRKVFSDTVIDAIARYLNNPKKPGRLLVALDPYVDQVQPLRLSDLLAKYGIEVRQEVTAFDKILGGKIKTANIFARLPEHKITEDLQTTQTIFPVACMVKPEKAASKSPYVAAALAETSEEGWGETDVNAKCEYDKGVDPDARPLPIAACSAPKMDAASKKTPGGPRVVVIGDSGFVGSDVIEKAPANVDFMLNCINWLGGKNTQLGIAAKPMLPPRVQIGPIQQGAVFFGTLIGLPYIALVIGGIVYWRRSR